DRHPADQSAAAADHLGHSHPAVQLPRGRSPRHGRRSAPQPGQIGHRRVAGQETFTAKNAKGAKKRKNFAFFICFAVEKREQNLDAPSARRVRSGWGCVLSFPLKMAEKKSKAPAAVLLGLLRGRPLPEGAAKGWPEVVALAEAHGVAPLL